MCSTEESREDSNKMKKKGTRTTEADANFEIYEVQLKNSTSRRDNVEKDRKPASHLLLEPIEITSINTTTNTFLF